MNKSSQLIRATALIVLTLLLIPAISYLNQRLSGSYGITTHQAGTIDFPWQDIHGKSHHFSDWQQGPTYLFLGFLNCSQICPIRTHQVKSLMQQLPEAERQQLRFLFITIDPLNDTPALREQLLDSQSPQFFSAEVEPTQLESLQQQLSEVSSKMTDINLHTGNLYLISAEGKLQHTYTQQQLDIEKLLNDLQHMKSPL